MAELEDQRVDAWVDRFRLSGQQTPRIPWHALRNRPLTGAEARIVAEFHDCNGARAGQHPSLGLARARFRHSLLQAVFGELGRVVDVGRGADATLAEFRRAGVDCAGLDGCGAIDAMPFELADRLRTLVAFDCIEHEPIDRLMQLPAEIDRLGIRQVALAIEPSPLDEARLTVQDRQFYEALMGRAGMRLMREWTPVLARLRVPSAWNVVRQRVEWTELSRSDPRRGWNEAPGYLFFKRD